MKVKFKEHELELYYSMRIYIIYENVVGNSVDEINANSITATTSLIYATIASTLRHYKINEDVTLDDIVDMIDENGGMKFITEFSKWFTGKVNAEAELIAVPDEDKKKV